MHDTEDSTGLIEPVNKKYKLTLDLPAMNLMSRAIAKDWCLSNNRLPFLYMTSEHQAMLLRGNKSVGKIVLLAILYL